MSHTTASALNNRVVTFIHIIDAYECVICMQVADDPVRCSLSCPAISCSACMQQTLVHTRHCPTCNKDINIDINILELRDIRTRNDILSQQVYCLNKADEYDNINQHTSTDSGKRKAAPDSKCTWTGKYDQLATHLNQCDFEMVKCTNIGCEDEFERWMMGEHLQVCIHRMANCGHCNDVVKAAAMLNHLRKCPKVDVSCECSFECLRDELPAHRDKDCPLVEIGCDVIGCDAKMMRGEYEKHQEQAASHHVRLLSTALEQQEASLHVRLLLVSLKYQAQAVLHHTRLLSEEIGILKLENIRLKEDNLTLLAAAETQQIISITPMQFNWRITDIAAKLLETIVDEKDYNSPRFDVFFHGGHKLYIQAYISGLSVGLYLCKDAALSDDKSGLNVGGTSFTVTKAGMPDKKQTLPLEMIMTWSLGFGSFLRDITPYIDNNALNIILDLNLSIVEKPIL